METYFKLVCLVLIFLPGGCKEEVEVPPAYASLISPEEIQLSGEWQYESITVGGNSFSLADRFLTPAPQDKKTQAGGERAILSRRRVNYSQEHTYQLRWNRSEYQLGTYGDSNWQPDFGTWMIIKTANGDSLIHNDQLHYRTAYSIEFLGKKMIRTSRRYMSGTFNTGLWQAGETLEFREVFVRP